MLVLHLLSITYTNPDFLYRKLFSFLILGCTVTQSHLALIKIEFVLYPT